PVLAYAYMKLGKIVPAERYFERYLDGLDPNARMLYEDIRFVASREELAAFNATPIDEREGFLRRFWNLHDPDITTAENERRIEHYWRVWYALHHFSEGQSPWDRRGEVYIRFGEPDYRSQSDELNFEQSLAVQRIKERLALSIYGTKVHPKEFLRSGRSNPYNTESLIAPLGATYVGPVYPVRSLRGKISEFQGYTAELFEISTGSARESRTDIFRPVTASEDGAMVAWENWIYVDIGDGLDITFTDERGLGIYDYAPAPPGDMVPLKQLAVLHRYNPRTVTEQAAAQIPDYYRPLENEDPSEFYYASADFRGEDEKTMCEVYLGVPHTLGYYFATEDETRLSVERTIALINTETGSIYRSRAPLHFRNAGDVTGIKGAVVPDVIRLNVPPGSYKMEVSVQDLISIGKGRYRQDMEIEAYPQTQLRVSDLELAWQIFERKERSKFSKGHLEVIPMPTRTYPRDRSIYVYYEIYNLKRNAFGQTRYRVAYTIRSQEKMTLGALVSQLVKTITKGEDEEIAIDFEQVGRRSSEATYIALDLTACGLGRHTVSVKITDLESGERAVKKASFVVAD
ncbi:MAG: GWxTD domain-containing protein, partial [Gemmatimonadetes bacterium]|nr:GWxTD domain-containing protein [Gemmatimonadota bacterium]